MLLNRKNVSPSCYSTFLLKRDIITKPFQASKSASLDRIAFALLKIGAPQLIIGLFFFEDMVNNDQNTVSDGNERFFLANAPCQT